MQAIICTPVAFCQSEFYTNIWWIWIWNECGKLSQYFIDHRLACGHIEYLMIPFKFHRDLWHRKTTVPGYRAPLRLSTLIQYRSVTDTQTHRHTTTAYTALACTLLRQGPSVNKEYLSQIQLYSMFGELPLLSNTVLIITVCVKVANSTFLVTNKRTKWAELSRYYWAHYMGPQRSPLSRVVVVVVFVVVVVAVVGGL